MYAKGWERIDQLIGRHAALLSERLAAHRARIFSPDAQKTLRRFTSGEVAELLGVTDAYLRKLSLEVLLFAFSNFFCCNIPAVKIYVTL